MKSIFMAPKFLLDALSPQQKISILLYQPGTHLISWLGTLLTRDPKWDVVLCMIASSLSWEATKPELHNNEPGTL